ncbi:MAG: PEPxxWA-CTERM sorting domain-containing protein [Candidatus Sphingomonas colombiensis]|nr:PEPxxWA-CTERM sorting domain-containing protein [Sphingomonas sp.]WEK41615.1 MAG: PEPxxWA-CTERM sorting domain-containing protein [Sphingomonas sp.]
MIIKFGGAAALALSALTVAMPASAAVTVGGFTLTANDSFGGQNGVHSNGTQSGNTIYGNVNGVSGNAGDVTFTSTNALSITGKGEATVQGAITNLDVLFGSAWDNLTFSFANMKKGSDNTFTMLVNGIALFDSSNCSICTVTGSGQNKFTLAGTGIYDVAFNFNPGIGTAKQFRVEGLSSAGVPEPATWALMIMGFGAVGGMLRSRRRGAVRFAA